MITKSVAKTGTYQRLALDKLWPPVTFNNRSTIVTIGNAAAQLGPRKPIVEALLMEAMNVQFLVVMVMAVMMKVDIQWSQEEG